MKDENHPEINEAVDSCDHLMVPQKRRVAPNALSHAELVCRASALKVRGLTIFPGTVRKKDSGYFYVKTECDFCGCVAEKELRNMEKGFSSKCQCQAKNRASALYPGVDHAIVTSLRQRFSCMKQRCEQDTHVSTHNYKGRGIKVLFKTRDEFVRWALEKWPGETFEGLDFDRIDNDGHYSRENLRLVTRTVNLLNRRDSKNSIRARAQRFQQEHPEVIYSYRTIWNLIQQRFTEAEIVEQHKRWCQQKS